MTLIIPDDFLRQTASHVAGAKGARQAVIIAATQPILLEAMIAYGIDTELRAIYFAGQLCVESDQFCTTIEYSSGNEYEGRNDLGNTKDGDGARFRGRGFIQLTGRANYVEAGKVFKLDLINHPELVAELPLALGVSCWFWQRHHCNGPADNEDILAVTRIINGGRNGLDQRQIATDRAYASLGYTPGGV